MMAIARTFRTPRGFALLYLLGSWPGIASSAAQEFAASEETFPRKATAESGRANFGESTAALQKENRKERFPLVTRFAEDQRRLWTSPERIRFSDAEWLVPAGGFAAALFVTDRDASLRLSRNPKTISRYNTISNGGAGALLGGAGGLWLLGHVRHDSHWSESGFLAGEAVLNSFVMVEGLKYSLGRERPFHGNGGGAFFQGGTSFPSEHAAAAWAAAGVLAHEYPGPLTKLLAYGLAGAVSYSRVRGRQHFPSDVFIGGMMGNLVAQEIYTRHHDTELGGAAWRSVGEIVRGDGVPSPSRSGSPFVPLDSWVYPMLDRLAALGVIRNEFLGMRPWTRLECARLVEEAEDGLAERGLDAAVAGSSLGMLESEFASEREVLGGGSNREMKLESVYTRGMQISGQPLADSAHFGQTVINDFGRPYQEGFSNATGFSGFADAGRYTVYVRGEYQHAPAGPAYPLPVRQAIAFVDANPVQLAQPVAAVDQYRLVEAYVGANVENWQLTFGKQSLWWGPGEGGALLFSDNAEPIYMFRASRISPFKLPWILQWLGPAKFDIFFGQLAGNAFPPRPLIHGEKISFKPTPNLEFGFSRTVEMGGVGRPLTLRALWNSYTSFTSVNNETPANDPGKRTGGFDFSYRVPFVRNWMTLYADSLADDDPSPLAAPRRAGVSPGIYFPRIPGIQKLDLRVEAVYTDTPTSRSNRGQYIYFDGFYHDLYTNKKNIIGSWIGREGQGLQAWSKYSFNARNSIQFGYRHARVSSDFIPGGGTLNDASVQADFLVGHELGVSSRVQYEHWNYPILAPQPQTNVSVSVEMTYWPRLHVK
jgi:membrane-associated phospholipid phosphatase